VIVETLRILPAPARRADVLNVLQSIQGSVLAQPGCAAYHVYEEFGPEEAVILVERWECRSAFKAHLRSEAYRRILGAMELAAAPPEVHFDTLSGAPAISLPVLNR
jgi:quinol monooxygenase YgiN